MQLRDHPLMNYRGIPNWPPHWHRRKDAGGEQACGEIGVLKDSVLSCGNLHNRYLSQIYLFMEHDRKAYIASVLFGDPTFCRQVGELMEQCYGRTLEEIGGLDVKGLM
ncbi:MAG TPA: hypothetical protein VKH64_12375 [Candidatus Binatia bacterium]|nr:hypothetical protein [Candidatus Binatia bacterium]